MLSTMAPLHFLAINVSLAIDKCQSKTHQNYNDENFVFHRERKANFGLPSAIVGVDFVSML